MNREQALEKIKKCLALSRSSNVHEAAAAMRQAQKLMAQHQLTEETVSFADVLESKVPTSAAELRPWESSLAGLVAHVFGCEHFCTQRWVRSGGSVLRGKVNFVFIGVGAAAEVASYTYSVLQRQCLRDRLAHVKAQSKRCKPATKTARGDEFAAGWVRGVQQIVGEFAGRDEDQKLVSQYMNTKYANLSVRDLDDRTKGRNISHNDRMEGIRAGQQAKLHRGVAGAQQGLLT